MAQLERHADVRQHGPWGREPDELLPFSAVRGLGPRGERFLGLQPIELERVVGSLDRHRDFDRRFRPKRRHLDERWETVRRLYRKGHGFEPIKVVKVGALYFVEDGHHRVSVARAEGGAYIDAVVVELEVAAPPQAGEGLRDLERKAEALASGGCERVAQPPQPGPLERLLAPLRDRLGHRPALRA